MRKNPGKYRKWNSIFSALLLIGSLLLSGCTSKPDGKGQKLPTETTKTTEAPGATQDTQAVTTEPTANASEDSSLVIFRQAMVETPQLFAAAYFGYADQDADPFAVMLEAAPQLCEDLPFLLGVREENVIGTSGFLFCIVPADENATVAVNRRLWNTETESYEEPEVLYRSEAGDPILVMCPNDNWMPDTEVVITDSWGNIAVWYPHLDSSYCVAPLCDDSGESLIFDFTAYDEIPDPVWEPGIDSSNLAGTWELAWTEVEGDRNEAAPGVCTIEITPDETGFFWFTYVNKDFPEENVYDRELIVIPGELYPGCGNDEWVADLDYVGPWDTTYAITLTTDDILIKQNYFLLDGAPSVSYEYFYRVAE